MPAYDLARRWTREEVLALPDDGNRYELVDGELLVSPNPIPVPQRAVARLLRLIGDYVASQRLGEAFISPADLKFRPDEILQPDLFVASASAGKLGVTWEDVGIPLLVVEVLSPRTARYDRVTKRLRYRRAEVPAYWIVDLDARVVEAWTSDSERPTVASTTIAWQPEPGIPALELDLGRFFTEVLDR